MLQMHQRSFTLKFYHCSNISDNNMICPGAPRTRPDTHTHTQTELDMRHRGALLPYTRVPRWVCDYRSTLRLYVDSNRKMEGSPIAPSSESLTQLKVLQGGVFPHVVGFTLLRAFRRMEDGHKRCCSCGFQMPTSRGFGPSPETQTADILTHF